MIRAIFPITQPSFRGTPVMDKQKVTDVIEHCTSYDSHYPYESDYKEKTIREQRKVQDALIDDINSFARTIKDIDDDSKYEIELVEDCYEKPGEAVNWKDVFSHGKDPEKCVDVILKARRVDSDETFKTRTTIFHETIKDYPNPDDKGYYPILGEPDYGLGEKLRVDILARLSEGKRKAIVDSWADYNKGNMDVESVVDAIEQFTKNKAGSDSGCYNWEMKNALVNGIDEIIKTISTFEESDAQYDISLVHIPNSGEDPFDRHEDVILTVQKHGFDKPFETKINSRIYLSDWTREDAYAYPNIDKTRKQLIVPIKTKLLEDYESDAGRMALVKVRLDLND